jgi:hypothetical protein
LTADAVCHALEQNGVRCWIAPRDVHAGANYGAEIIRGIRECKLFVLVFSANSNKSTAVHKELETAFSQGKTIIPFRTENIKVSDEISFYIAGNHWLDAYPNDKVFVALVNAAKMALGQPIIGKNLSVVPKKDLFGWLRRKQKTTSLPIQEINSVPIDTTATEESALPPVSIPVPKPDTSTSIPSMTLPQSIQTSTPTEPVYSLEKIPEDAIRFVPRGTAYIILKDNTRYIVTANSLMYQSKASGSLGMKNGFIKDDGGVISFTEIKWYEDEDVLNVDGEKVDIVQDNGQLSFIVLEKKRMSVTVTMDQVKSIYFDWANIFDSIVYYTLLHQVDGPPLVIPAASMFIQIFGIHMFGGPYYNFRSEIPFPNEENIPLKRIKCFEIATVSHKPSGKDHTCEVEIIVETSSGEVLKDKIRGAISLCSLSKKGIASLDLYKIKSFTILEASQERLAATTPLISVFPSVSLSAQQTQLIPETISLAASQIIPFQSEGTVRIVVKDGTEYTAPANAIAVRTWDGFTEGIKKYYNDNFQPVAFSNMKRLQSILLPKEPNKYSEWYEYTIELRDGSTEKVESEKTSVNLIFPYKDNSCILPLFDIESMDFDWNTPCSYHPKLITVLKNDGSSVSFSEDLFFIGYKIRPDENAIGWNSGIHWEKGLITNKKQMVKMSQLSGVQFLVYRVSKRDFKGYNKWIKECKVEFEYTDGRKVITDLSMDSIHLIGVNNLGTMEISGENIKYIHFGN